MALEQWIWSNGSPRCPGAKQLPIPAQLHQGLIAHGEHLTSRCQGWSDEMTRRRGWAPEVAWPRSLRSVAAS
jgi:hypothetical protein